MYIAPFYLTRIHKALYTTKKDHVAFYPTFIEVGVCTQGLHNLLVGPGCIEVL